MNKISNHVPKTISVAFSTVPNTSTTFYPVIGIENVTSYKLEFAIPVILATPADRC
jgi:hypothetical protein